jgi:hypothetical protein
MAAERARQEHPVLLEDRPVESERRRGARAFDLVGDRIDQDVDRVADHVQPEEHEQRRDEQHQGRLREAAEDVDGHQSEAGSFS